MCSQLLVGNAKTVTQHTCDTLASCVHNQNKGVLCGDQQCLRPVNAAAPMGARGQQLQDTQR
eukprot:m.494863 g.494863  ORF g.494863 m.494863 type:complete len:62 (-) comp42096_c0_seq1:153-338(-)